MDLMGITYGTAHWDATPGDPTDGPLIAAELDTYVRLSAEARQRDAEVAFDAFLASLDQD